MTKNLSDDLQGCAKASFGCGCLLLIFGLGATALLSLLLAMAG